MEIVTWVIIGVIIAVVLVTALATFSSWRKKKKKAATEQVQSKSEIKKEDGTPVVGLNRGDITIGVQTTLKAEKGGVLAPGRYTILSADSSVDKFNVRLGKFVKECRHGDIVVLAEGDEITPTSNTIILR